MVSRSEAITLPKGCLGDDGKVNNKVTPDARTAHYSLGIYDFS